MRHFPPGALPAAQIVLRRTGMIPTPRTPSLARLATFACLLLAGAMAGVSKLASIRAEKEERYKEQTQRLTAMKKLEAETAPKRKNFEDQKAMPTSRIRSSATRAPS